MSQWIQYGNRFIAVLAVSAMLVPAPLRVQAQAGAATAARRSPVAPRTELVQAAVNEAYDKFKNDTGGKNADYIPVLAKVDSKLFGITVVATDNQTISKGDVGYSFSIQSIA